MIASRVLGEQSLRHQLQMLALPPAKRRKVLLQLGKMSREAAKKRITNQTNIGGSRFAPRKRKERARLKMLRGLKKGLVVNTNTDSTTITYKNGIMGRIARAQQEGIAQTVTAAQMARRNPTASSKPATRIQARALIAEGFVVRGPGSFENTAGRRVYKKGIRTPGKVGWITKNMSMQQAGAILRSMRGRGASSWVLPGTARSFLGAAAGDVDAMLGTIFQTLKAQT